MKAKRKHRRKRAPIRVPKRRELAAPPGLVLPEAGAPEPRFRVMSYGPDSFSELGIDSPSAIAGLRRQAPVCWIDIDGVGDAVKIEELARMFAWHELVLEDVVSHHQRPKVEDYDEYAYVVVHMPSGPDGLPLEQLSILFGRDYVVTVQGGIPGDCLEPVRERIRNARGRIRHEGSDYLAYALIDAVVDHYFPVVEKQNDQLERLEEQLVSEKDEVTLGEMHAVRNDLHTLWRALAATRESIGLLARGETGPVSDGTRPYLQDCQDHCAQLLDAVSACRELSLSLMELHHAAMNNRMSEGMRILTLIATIFMPMSFIAGLYGMNFDRSASPLNMPELGWPMGYPFALSLMLLTGLGFLLLFRRRGWIGPGRVQNQRRPAPGDTPSAPGES